MMTGQRARRKGEFARSADADLGAAAHPLASGGSLPYEIDEEVVAERLGRRVKRATTIDRGHLLDERAQSPGLVENEGVDDDALAGAAEHLGKRGVDRLAHRWVVEEDLAVVEDVR